MTFRPLAALQVSRHDISGSIADRRDGYNYSRVELMGLGIDGASLLIRMRFTPTTDGRNSSHAAWTGELGEVEFLMLEKDGWYLGGIAHQDPADFGWWDGPSAQAGGGLYLLRRVKAEPNFYKPRQQMRLGVRRKGAPYGIDPDCEFCLYVRPALFGGWSEIIVQAPRADFVWMAKP